jgi:hypothetical protein
MLFNTSSKRFPSTIPLAKTLESDAPKAFVSLRSSLMRFSCVASALGNFFVSSSSMFKCLFVVCFLFLPISGCMNETIHRKYSFEKNRDDAESFSKAKSNCRYKADDYTIKAASSRKYVSEDLDHDLYINCMKYKDLDMTNYKKERRYE